MPTSLSEYEEKEKKFTRSTTSINIGVEDDELSTLLKYKE